VPSRFRWNDYVLDLDAFRLERAGVPIPLEPKAFTLLALMVQRPGHLFTKQEIFDRVWPETAVTDHALTRIVAQIRRALGDEAREARFLETVPTRGYRWIHPVESDDAKTPRRASDDGQAAQASVSAPHIQCDCLRPLLSSDTRARTCPPGRGRNAGGRRDRTLRLTRLL